MIMWLAPPIFYLIGDGKGRASATRRRASAIVSVLVTVVVLGLIVSVTGNWLYARWFTPP